MSRSSASQASCSGRRAARLPPAEAVPVARNGTSARVPEQFRKQEVPMSLRIADKAPDFEAETTQGRIHFHEWLGNSWCVLFSHPKDFTPVCTTELGYLAKLEPEFRKRNCKVIGLSVDPVGDHSRWLED